MSKITTHILDLACGAPARGIAVTLYHSHDTEWQVIAEGQTDRDGRVANLVATPLSAGDYKLRFATAPYYQATQQPTFYPYIEIVFTLAPNEPHYHVPLLLNAHGYTTYRGS